MRWKPPKLLSLSDDKTSCEPISKMLLERIAASVLPILIVSRLLLPVVAMEDLSRRDIDCSARRQYDTNDAGMLFGFTFWSRNGSNR